MKHHKILKLILLVQCLLLTSNDFFAYPAIIAVPVADVLAGSVESFEKDASLYYQMPYSPESTVASCPRAYQLLYNEVIDVIEEKEHEYKIIHPGAFYLKNNVPCGEFYITKQSACKIAAEDLPFIPSMPDAEQGLAFCSENDVVLIDSFNHGNVVFSAGTRFKVYHMDADCCYVYCGAETCKIPKKLLFTCDNTLSYQDRVVRFIEVLRRWAHNDAGFVPYVLGGASVTYRIPENIAAELIEKDSQTVWQYSGYDHATKSGMDCSDLIIRAAQIAGLPFFYKNTATMEHFLKNSTEHDHVEVGDIIWYKGHVIVIADLVHNTCIEARGYSAGYGKVQEIPVGALFEGINTFDDLKLACLSNKELAVLKWNGEVDKRISTFKILKLKSMWSKAY